MRLHFELSTRRLRCCSGLAIALLLAVAGCRDVLGIHAATGDPDANDLSPAGDPDAGSSTAGTVSSSAGRHGDGSGMDEAGQGGTSGRGAVSPLGGRGGAAGGGAASGGKAGTAGAGGTGGRAGISGAGSGDAGSGGAGMGGPGMGGAGSGGAGMSGAGMSGAGSGGAGTGTPACEPVCDLGDKQCATANELQTCELIDGCAAWKTIEPCSERQTCSPSGTSAVCTCLPPPAACTGISSGNACQSDTEYTHCSTDANGCVVATPGSCSDQKPCRGNPGQADCTCLNPPSTQQCPMSLRDGTRCSGGSVLRCGTDAAGCLRFEQTDCDTGVCGGTYPDAACVEEREVGWPDDLGSMQTHITGGLAGTRITVPAAAVLRRFGIISRTAGTHAILVLYDEQDGAPHARVAATTSNTLATGVNEFAVALPPAQVTLAAGSYWLMLSVDATTQIAHGTSTVPLAYLSYTHGSPIPSPLEAVAFDEMPELNFYIVVLPQ